MLRIVGEWVSAHAKLEARITLRYVSACHKYINIINTYTSLIIEVSFQGVCVCVRERERGGREGGREGGRGVY